MASVNLSVKESNTYSVQSKNPTFNLADKTEDEEKSGISIVFIPDNVTPLDKYEKELLKAGLSKKHVKEIIEGLADSPLYESKTSK